MNDDRATIPAPRPSQVPTLHDEVARRPSREMVRIDRQLQEIRRHDSRGLPKV